MIKLVFATFGILMVHSVTGQAVDPEFCRNNGVSIGVLPHPNPLLCNYFVVCANGQPFPTQCNPNEIFWPPTGDCQPGYPETCELTTVAPTTTIPIEVPTTTGPGGITPLPPNICEGLFFRTIPHPNNCYQYILCLAQIPHLGECQSHQIYHAGLNICIRGNRDTCEFCLFCRDQQE